jgi:hypothetical protein
MQTLTEIRGRQRLRPIGCLRFAMAAGKAP